MSSDNRPGAVYARRSVEDLANPGLSIPLQIERGLTFWSARTVPVPPEHVYVDADISGKNLTGRPAVLQLLAAMRAGDVQGVWVYNVDRFMRNLYDLPTIQQAADDGHCVVWAGDRQLDWQNPEAEVGLIVEATFAQYYRKRIAKNTKEALHKKAADGLFAGGRIPFWLRTEGHGHLVIAEEWTPVLLRIFAAYAAGTSTNSIALALEADGVPTPRGGLAWGHKTVRKVLGHPSHYGRNLYGGDDNASNVPRVVPDGLVEAARARLTTSSHRRGPNTVSHVFWRLVRCGVCGLACHRRRKVAHGKEYYSLQCNGASCALSSVPWGQVDTLEMAILSLLRDSEPTARVWSPDPGLAARIAELQESKRIETAVLRAGGCTVDQYEASMRRITDQMARLAPPPMPEDPAGIQSIATTWDALSIGERNALLRRIVEAVTIHRGRIDVTFRGLGWDAWPKLLTFHRGTDRTRLIY